MTPAEHGQRVIAGMRAAREREQLAADAALKRDREVLRRWAVPVPPAGRRERAWDAHLAGTLVLGQGGEVKP